jgi:hypothetical protein
MNSIPNAGHSTTERSSDGNGGSASMPNQKRTYVERGPGLQFASSFPCFLTAKAEKLDIGAGMNLGADDYKPVAKADLLAAVCSRLEQSDGCSQASPICVVSHPMGGMRNNRDCLLVPGLLRQCAARCHGC